MRLLLITILTLSVGAGATFAQTGIGESSQSGAAPGSPHVNPTSLTNANVLLPLRLLPGAVSSTTSPIPSATTPGATGISPLRLLPSRQQSRQNAHDSAVADCMQMWDKGTHMTKQEWLRTCKRIETRLDNLNIDAVMPGTRTNSQKSASDKKQLR